MNIFKLSFRYLTANILTTFTNILLILLGVGMLIVLLIAMKQSEDNFTNNLKGIDMVIGAKGSPQQIILSSVYHADYPTGNIKLADAEIIAKNSFVSKAIPLGLGDSYQGYRIVGTNKDYPTHYQAVIESGKWWNKEMEVVLGAIAAQKLRLKVGDKFAGSHGLADNGEAHEQFYEVVGIMQTTNTVLDRLILTDLSSIWHVHDEHETENISQDTSQNISQDTLQNKQIHEDKREITAMLLTFKSPMGNVMLPRITNQISNLQAAVPAIEMARLFILVGTGTEILENFAYLIIFIAMLNIFVVFYTMMKTRQYDLALMRTLGASATKTATLLLLEVSILAGVGIFLGVILGHSSLILLNEVGEKFVKLNPTTFYIEEFFVVLAVWIVALFAALLPAIQAYRLEVATVLKSCAEL
jgi:putative ABC transport system permease protein